MAKRRRKTTTRQRDGSRPTQPTRPARPELAPPPGDEFADENLATEAIADSEPVAAASGSSVGILLAIGVVLGAIVTYPTSLNLLIGCAVGGVLGAILGIVIDRRRNRPRPGAGR